MSKADKIFEELGYTEIEEFKNGISYYKSDKDNITFIEYDNTSFYVGRFIEFHIFDDLINMQELQAINEKVKELGWNE